MILRTVDTVCEGRAIDARDLPVDANTVLEAIGDSKAGTDEAVAVDAPDPGPLHDRVGYLGPGVSIRTRTALALAARSRGLSAPQDDQIERIEEKLDEIEPPTVETTDVRRQAADRGAETDRLRERVAELRGQIRARREQGADASDLESELADAVRRLSEAETERVAASQRLDGTAESAREARNVRDRRMRLQDRKANREREARAHLVAEVQSEYADAVVAVPESDVSPAADPFAVDDLTAALAVARVADLSAPVVLACDRFETPAAAADWLGAAVVRVS